MTDYVEFCSALIELHQRKRSEMNEDAKPAPDEAAWVHIRMRYEQTVETVKQIAESIGVPAIILSKKAKLEGWLMRGAANKKPKTESTRDTIKRLKEILQKRLANLEREMNAIGEDISALANERDIRATNTLVRTLEKVLQLEQKDRRQRGGHDTRKLNNAERDELARRIANLPEESEVILGDVEASSGAEPAARVALLGEA
jgi:transcriptional regulator of heat shock response